LILLVIFTVDIQHVNQIFFNYVNSEQNYRNLLYCRPTCIVIRNKVLNHKEHKEMHKGHNSLDE